MIYGNSTHPVLIKKIGLRIWTLRDEIQSLIRKRLEQGEENLKLDDLIEEYSNLKPQLATEESATEEAASEDDMAKAMEEGADEASEEDQAESSDGPSEEKAQEESNIIEQKYPPLSQEQILNAKTILSEISMTDIFFFCNHKFLVGQSIVVEFLVPEHFIVNAEIIYSKPLNMKSRIISETPMSYRCCAQFTFMRPGQRTILRRFLTSVEPEIPVAPQKPKVAQEEEDDFDELDDLDL